LTPSVAIPQTKVIALEGKAGKVPVISEPTDLPVVS